MKVFSYIGTKRGTNSNTYRVVKMLINEMKQFDSNLECEIITSTEYELMQCSECLNCFDKGYCVKDNVDNFNAIKDKMLNSDVIIFGTPVLGANVSGEMKKLIDRLSYWLHLMPLISKIGVSVVTASSNSLMETNSYLKKIMESFGLFVSASILCTVDMPNMIDSPQFQGITLKGYAKEIMDYALKNKKIYSSKYQELYFKHLKDGYDVPIDSDNAELKYWREKDLFKYKTYNELINDLVNN